MSWFFRSVRGAVITHINSARLSDKPSANGEELAVIFHRRDILRILIVTKIERLQDYLYKAGD